MVQFVKHFFKKLSHNGINGLFAHKTDHQTIGKADDICAAIAITPVHTVVIRAGSFGDGDLTVFYGDKIISYASDADLKFTVNPQVQGFQQRAVTEDLHMGGSLSGKKHGNADTNADQKYCGKQNDPVFCLHWGTSLECRCIAKYTKKVGITQEKG